MIECGYKFRLYPTDEQKEFFIKQFGCCRYVYNYYLDVRKKQYEETKKTMSGYDCCKDLTQLKKTTPWLAEVDSSALNDAVLTLDVAFQNFFRGIKKGQHIGYPRFRSKQDNTQSYKTKMQNVIRFSPNGKYIMLPKVGEVRCVVTRPMDDVVKITSATVTHTASDRWFISVHVRKEDPEPFDKSGAIVGLDFGTENNSIITSDGDAIKNEHPYIKEEARIQRMQQALSRKQKGSNNYEKARIKLARAHEKLRNKRIDDIHKATTELVKKYDVICYDNMDIRSVIAEKKESKETADTAIGEIRRQIAYKATWYGKTAIPVKNNECPHCGHIFVDENGKARHPTKLDICPNCGKPQGASRESASLCLDIGMDPKPKVKEKKAGEKPAKSKKAKQAD